MVINDSYTEAASNWPSMERLILLALLALSVRAMDTQPITQVSVDFYGPRTLQAGGVGILSMSIPMVGSLSPIYGTLQLPPGFPDPDAYKFCVYLESFGSGLTLYNGPKPAENDGSFSPISADGSYSFTGWWANALLDPVSPFIHGFAYHSNLGNCLPVLGTPVFPAGMLTDSVAYIRVARENSLEMTLTDAPPLGATAGSFKITVQGIPASPVELAVIFYSSLSAAGPVVGPLPSCTAAAKFLVVLDPPGGDTGYCEIPASAATAAPAFLHFFLVSSSLIVTATPIMFLDEVTTPASCGAALPVVRGFRYPQVLEGIRMATVVHRNLPLGTTESPYSSPSATGSASALLSSTVTVTPQPQDQRNASPSPKKPLAFPTPLSSIEVFEPLQNGAPAPRELLWGGIFSALTAIALAFK
jgi:hypothetical protein